jgi:hypothetical protein
MNFFFLILIWWQTKSHDRRTLIAKTALLRSGCSLSDMQQEWRRDEATNQPAALLFTLQPHHLLILPRRLLSPLVPSLFATLPISRSLLSSLYSLSISTQPHS